MCRARGRLALPLITTRRNVIGVCPRTSERMPRLCRINWPSLPRRRLQCLITFGMFGSGSANRLTIFRDNSSPHARVVVHPPLRGGRSLNSSSYVRVVVLVRVAMPDHLELRISARR